MAAVRLGIHLAPQANPTTVGLLISRIVEENLEFSSIKSLVDHLETWSIPARTEIPALASEIGLLGRNSSCIEATENGRAFCKLRDDAKADALHFLIYSTWNERDPFTSLQSWSYRKACNFYWSAGNVVLEGPFLDRQVEEVINEARAFFSPLTADGIEEVSFSRKSLRGVQNWLESLIPPVLENDTFSRRHFCPPELLILALAHIYSDDPDIGGSDVLLTQARRDALCRLCLLEPDALDRTLDWALGAFPTLVEKGTTAGTYGRFLRFRKVPTLTDLVQ